MNRQFAALSGLAIAVVVLNHSIHMVTLISSQAGFAPPENWARFILETLRGLGVLPVPTFMFITGSFLAYAAQGNPPRLTYKAVTTRLTYILCPYLLWCVVFYVLVYIQLGESYTLAGYVKNLIVGYPFHFVPLFVFWYVLSPILVRLSNQFGWYLVIAIAAYQLILINIVYPGALGFTFPDGMRVLAPPVLRVTLADWAVYLPMGIVFGINARHIAPQLLKFKWVFVALTALFLALSLAHDNGLLNFPLAGHICPFTLMFLLPLIRRDLIPLAPQLEKIGGKSYGLYLMHLITIDGILIAFKALVPALLSLQALLHPLMFALGLGLPMGLMQIVSRSPAKRVYRYLFG
jgi:hypothetical protein